MNHTHQDNGRMNLSNWMKDKRKSRLKTIPMMVQSLPKIQNLIHTHMISTLTQIYSFKLRRSISQEAKLWRRIPSTPLHHMVSEELQALKGNSMGWLDMKETMINSFHLDLEVYRLVKLTKTTKRKCTAQVDHLNSMRIKITTESSGEFTFKTRTLWQTLTKLRTNATKCPERCLISKTFTKIPLCPKF